MIFSCLLGIFIFLSACSSQRTSFDFPRLRAIKGPRSQELLRVITHFHSPYSYDACDYNGIQNGKLNQSCLDHLKDALCQNHVDFLFLTDHPDAMAQFDFHDLLLKEAKDQAVLDAQQNWVGTEVGSCLDGFRPQILAGFESNLMALGMKRHLTQGVSPLERQAYYTGVSRELRDQLKDEAEALVVIPHTEDKSVDWIASLEPDGIEIYNIHANVDPKIRHAHLGLPPFSFFTSLITYAVDPYRELKPDFSFLHFLEVSQVYFQKWNSLLGRGFKLPGFAGTDSHENTLPQAASDGERLDAHRRLIRFVSNSVLVPQAQLGAGAEFESVKTALREGRFWIIFEGLGVPAGYDFHLQIGKQVFEMGESGNLETANARDEKRIFVQAPLVHTPSPLVTALSPKIRIQLKHIASSGEESLVAEKNNEDISFVPQKEGAYRVSVWITPTHLKPLITDFPSLTEQEYLWMLSNPIYLN